MTHDDTGGPPLPIDITVHAVPARSNYQQAGLYFRILNYQARFQAYRIRWLYRIWPVKSADLSVCEWRTINIMNVWQWYYPKFMILVTIIMVSPVILALLIWPCVGVIKRSETYFPPPFPCTPNVPKKSHLGYATLTCPKCLSNVIKRSATYFPPSPLPIPCFTPNAKLHLE